MPLCQICLLDSNISICEMNLCFCSWLSCRHVTIGNYNYAIKNVLVDARATKGFDSVFITLKFDKNLKNVCINLEMYRV